MVVLASLAGVVIAGLVLVVSVQQANGTLIVATSSLIIGTELLDTTCRRPKIYACQNEQWGKPCRKFTALVGDCLDVPSDWNDNISSIKNQDKTVFYCSWYEHDNCEGQTCGNQEDAKLRDGNGFFNDRISLWSCSYQEVEEGPDGTIV
ncbi:hypothetical protein QBC36DRAFT_186849 [Triangularia setosa]|uniref:Uncharacterized protein n=1 Tax=Triangularia setosa TaxID=2587417 RepID=A0AAN6W934_9PEZI|nr:hypothetical protein QBC36DRAFT_186849 [Podospora setosa]